MSFIEEVLNIRQRLRESVIAPQDPKVRARWAGLATSIQHQELTIITGIQHPRQRQLLFSIDALDAQGLSLSPGERREQQGRQDGDDGYYHQKLYQSEPGCGFGSRQWFLVHLRPRHGGWEVHGRYDTPVSGVWEVRVTAHT